MANYLPQLTRRDSLKMLAALAASTVLPACSPSVNPTADTGPLTQAAPWPSLSLAPVQAAGYGKDPNQILPPKAPWPLTLSPAELTLVATLADLILPRDGQAPSASDVAVPDVVNEWLSAPYPQQQQDRQLLMPLLAWLDAQSQLSFNLGYRAASKAQQEAILTAIAFREVAPGFEQAGKAFARLRSLVVSAYYCTPTGHQDIGYLGNTAIAGDYPGPTAEAMNHLNQVLSQLQLSEYAYPR